MKGYESRKLQKQKIQIPVISWNLDFQICIFLFLGYFPLLASATYFSKAIVIEGVSGVGARMSILKP